MQLLPRFQAPVNALRGGDVCYAVSRFGSPTNGSKESLSMVSKARYTHQKTNFPPVDVIDLQFEYQGSALVPVGA